jgi:hypothetical protein
VARQWYVLLIASRLNDCCCQGRFILSSQSTEPHHGLISAICFEKHTPQLATAGEVRRSIGRSCL